MVKIGIVGYGNLGRAAIANIANFPDLTIVAVFSRRQLTLDNIPCFAMEDMKNFIGKIDVMLMCGGSAKDLPGQSPEVLKHFCTVDSFDTHAKIPEFFDVMDKTGKEADKLAAISVGWDPGLFSMMRCMFSSFMPYGDTYTFWGKGVSQGHSDAVRRVEGVRKAIQYTEPKEEALSLVREGRGKGLETSDMHKRVCFVVAEENSDRDKISEEIRSMPNYFADYDTEVNFISESEFDQMHNKLPHGGFVLRSGEVGEEQKTLTELSINLESNPGFTSSILLSFCRAVNRLYEEGKRGAVTVLDIPLSALSDLTPRELRKNLL